VSAASGRECLAGFEPALRPWQGRVLPLHHRHKVAVGPLSDECGDEGARTLDLPVMSRALCQLSYVAEPTPGIEPGTSRLQGECSSI
jgi:hypothetical protein